MTLNIGVGALAAMQRALQTTSHNIANVNNDSYSRQLVSFSARPPQVGGDISIGKGVQVDSIERVADTFLNAQLRSATTSFGFAEQFESIAARIDAVLADPASGVSSALSDFFNSMQDVSDDPASIPLRETFLAVSETLVSRFVQLDDYLGDVETSLNGQMEDFVGRVNTLTASIADLNNDIVRLQGRLQGNTANDLVDQRDQLVRELSDIVGVIPVEQADGSMLVSLEGSGFPLVTGNSSNNLTTVPNALIANRLEVAIDVGGTVAEISSSLSRGRLSGVVAARSDVVDSARNNLGKVAAGLAQAFNAQHREGMDLAGAINNDFFTLAQPLALGAVSNTGSVQLALDPNGIGNLTASDYSLTHDGTDFTLTRLSDNTTTTLSGAGPFTVDGFTITVTSAPAAGDQYLVRPTANLAGTIGLNVTAPEEIAAAAPIIASAGFANVGTASVTQGEVLDVSNPALLTSINIVFADPPTNYQVNGVGPLIAYTPGADIDINGWRVQIDGSPVAGDSFTVSSNTGGSGDNRNALLLSGLQDSRLFDGGTSTLQGGYSVFVADVAAQALSARTRADATSTQLEAATDARLSLSGVNLDEEASNLIKFQRGYEAAAQIIQTAQETFDALLAAVRS